ncbi:MAG: hypothetical protein M1840_008080, partial [Geoglossum simile]
MASQSLRATARSFSQPMCLSLRVVPSLSYAAAASRRTYSCQRLAFNPTSTLRAQSFQPSKPKKAEQPLLPTATPVHNSDTPSDSTKPPNNEIQDLTAGFADQTLTLDEGGQQVDWARSFHGLSAEPFPKEVAEILTQPIPEGDVEVKPDGIIYLPEIKYRRILNRAFGPGGW